MTKMSEMIAAGIPVIESQSNEVSGSYSFSSMTAEQEILKTGILFGWPVAITSSSNILIGDGDDEITLTVHGTPKELMTIGVLTGQTLSSFDIQLDELGVGTQIFSCETNPTKIMFQHGDVTCEVRAF